MTTDFLTFSDKQVVAYLLEHYGELGVGMPTPGLAETLIRDIEAGTTALEKNPVAFAVIARANRRHPGEAGDLFPIEPEADLMFLMVLPEAQGKGVGSEFVSQVKRKYMEDQAMVLVCAGDDRKKFFMKNGFVSNGLTHEGFHYLVCRPSEQI